QPESRPQPPFDLRAATDTAEAPIAEVLAVIGQQAIIVLAEARSSASDNFLGGIRRPRVIHDPHIVAIGKSRQGYFLDRPALPESGAARIMHHSTVADIHPMMAVPATRSRQMSPQRRLLLKSRWYVVHLRFSRLPDIRSVVSWNTFGALRYQRIARSPCRISFVLDSISCGSRADGSSRTGRAVSRLLDSETVRDQAVPLAAYRSVRTPAPQHR